MLKTIKYQGMENQPEIFGKVRLKLFIRKLSSQQEIANRKIQLFIDIPGFLGESLEHQRLLTDAVMPFDEVPAGEEIQARILLINWRQILGLNQLAWIMVNGPAVLIVQPGLQACNREEGIAIWIGGQESPDRP